jgi:hypothetical protein
MNDNNWSVVKDNKVRHDDGSKDSAKRGVRLQQAQRRSVIAAVENLEIALVEVQFSSLEEDKKRQAVDHLNALLNILRP